MAQSETCQTMMCAESVLDNVLDGLLSKEIARLSYGVIIVGGQVDKDQTELLRRNRIKN